MPKPYVAVVHLVKRPPATREQWLYVADLAYSLGQSIVGSADDARDVVEDALPGSTVVVWCPEWWLPGDIVSYLQAHNPGVLVEVRSFTAIVFPQYPVFGQWNAFEIRRMQTSDPAGDARMGWPTIGAM